MNIKLKIIIGFLIISVAVCSIAYVTLKDLNDLVKPIAEDLPDSIELLNKQSDLDGKAQFIRYYDEVLTQSARNYAFTEDKKWEQRYRDVEPHLDKIIQDAIKQGNEIEAEFFSTVNDANQKLVVLEYDAIRLVNEGKPEQGIKILDSEEYWNQKQIYENALRDYVDKRGLAYNEALVASTDTLNQVSEETTYLVQNIINQVSFFIPVIVALGIGISYLLSHSVLGSIKNLTTVAAQVSKGNFDKKAKVAGNDEFGILATTFNSMLDSLKKSESIKMGALKKYQELYEKSPGLNRTIDMDGKIIDCNQSYADAFGYTKNETIGKSIFDFVPKGDQYDMKQSFETWKKTGQVKSQEIVFMKKDGTLFPGILSASNLYDDNGTVIGSNTIIQDLSVIHQAQKEIQELRTKRLSVIGELTSRIAHDMRNPLSIIKNSAELIKIKRKDWNEDERANWARLERGIYRISHQVDDVLEYIKSPKINKKDVKVFEICQDAIDRIMIPENIKIELKVDGEIFCDPIRFEIVLVNLIMNAVQAINPNKGKITISREPSQNETKYSLIKISDNGPGIPKEVLGKIFDPLFTTRQIGTGLGLPSCKNIIEKHGGKILVDSIVNKGTTFTIQLPTKTEWEEISKIGNKERLTDFITSLESKL